MKYTISIPFHDNSVYYFELLPYSDYQRIDVPYVVILDITKYHDHRYGLHGFFYRRKSIVGPLFFKTKKELYCAIQKLLQHFLYVDVQ